MIYIGIQDAKNYKARKNYGLILAFFTFLERYLLIVDIFGSILATFRIFILQHSPEISYNEEQNISSFSTFNWLYEDVDQNNNSHQYSCHD